MPRSLSGARCGFQQDPVELAETFGDLVVIAAVLDCLVYQPRVVIMRGVSDRSRSKQREKCESE